MSLSVNFYTNSSDNRSLSKNLAPVKAGVNCSIYGNIDRLNPALEIDKTDIDLRDCNYMEIPEFGRKYFITSIECDAGKTIIVHGHVDVLSTYAEQIKECPLIASRSSNLYNGYLIDERRQFENGVYNQYIHIGSFSPHSQVVLITTG